MIVNSANLLRVSLLVFFISSDAGKAEFFDLNNPDIKTCMDKKFAAESRSLIEAMQGAKSPKADDPRNQPIEANGKRQQDCFNNPNLHEELEAYRRRDALWWWAITNICDYRTGLPKPYPQDAGHTPERESIFNEERAKFAKRWRTDDINIACSHSHEDSQRRYNAEHPESQSSNETGSVKNEIDRQRRDLDDYRRATDRKLREIDDEVYRLKQGW